MVDLIGVTALGRALAWRPSPDGLAATWRRVRAPLVANLVLAASLTAVGGPALYLLTWVLPRATWYQALTRLRDIAEHGLVPGAEDPHAERAQHRGRARWRGRCWRRTA